MLRAATHEALALKDDLAPDRTGSIRGLSTTGFHDIVFADWGPRDADIPVLCIHGLTRQGRDFDYVARHLAASGRRVICPDLVGRGQSGRLRNPTEYALPQYCADMNALIAHLGVDQLDWIGTSLGGLIGMVFAGLPGHPIRRLIVNDIAPYLPWSGLARIGSYMSGVPAGFSDLDQAESYFRKVLAPFGALSDEHWRHITRHSVAWNEAQQRYVILCDPKIAKAFKSPWQYSLDLWKYWRAIDIPILVLRGTESDLLPPDLTVTMKERNPGMALREFRHIGHAPTLMTSDQIEVVSEFLET